MSLALMFLCGLVGHTLALHRSRLLPHGGTGALKPRDGLLGAAYRYNRSRIFEENLGSLFMVSDPADCPPPNTSSPAGNWRTVPLNKKSFLCYAQGPSASPHFVSVNDGERRVELPMSATVMRISEVGTCAGVPELLVGWDHQRDLLDDSPVVCWKLQSNVSMLVPHPVLTAEGETSLVQFPETEFPVVVQDPKKRQHFMVLGPEASGTRFVTDFIAMASNLTDDRTGEFMLNDASAIFHLSLPWGGVCGNSEVPMYKTFGGTPAAYAEDGLAVAKTMDIPGIAGRFMVDILNVTSEYRRLQIPLNVFLVVRDPRQSLFGKMHANCFASQAVGQEEQTEAFKLMLMARSEPEVTIVCYEDMVSVGAKYLRNALSSTGVDFPRLQKATEVHTIENSNTHSVPSLEQCTEAMRAYMTLCPNSTAAAEFATVCSE